MIHRFRAAAFAAAALLFAGAAMLFGGPVQAWEGSGSVRAFASLLHSPATLAGNQLHFSIATGTPLPLDELVANAGGVETEDAEQDCLASAVYFEARGEPLQGQLAVAEVVLNRAASGRYPATLCDVVVQPAQFSFVRHGRIPEADRASDAWRRAVGIAKVAVERMTPRLLPANCLWYHAAYVSPSWGRRLAQTTRIGLHIFYT